MPIVYYEVFDLEHEKYVCRFKDVLFFNLIDDLCCSCEPNVNGI